MTLLSDLPQRVHTLEGAIKQADADVTESELLVKRAEDKLRQEKETLERQIARAEALRTEAHELAEHAHAEIKALAYPPATREEVIPSTSVFEVADSFGPQDHVVNGTHAD